MPAANVNREFHFGELSPQSLRDNDKAIVNALAEIYSNKNLALNLRLFTTTATLDITDVSCLCDTTGGAITITLPSANSGSAVSVPKTKLLIFRSIAGANNVTITRAGTNTIEGATTYTLVPGSQVILWSDGVSKWYLVGRYEKSTFTPTDNSGAGLTFTVATANYIRNGNSVTINLHITYPVTASGANANIAGLPFGTAGFCVAPVSSNGAGNPVITQINGTSMAVLALGNTPVTNAQLSGAFVIVSFTYIV